MGGFKVQIDFARTEFGDEEIAAIARPLDKNWLASGEENEKFEKEIAAYVGTKYAICVNSGSSANLLALMALQLPKHEKVITSSCGFPATLSPILHCGNVPVLVDYDINTHNINVEEVLEQLPNVKAVIFAHTMGIPVDMKPIIDRAKELGVYVIEDCCEAIGAEYQGKRVGSFVDLSTFSFYPAHQITAGGEGGAICTNNQELALRIKSLRDWGKIWNWNQALGPQQTTFETNVDGITYYPGYTYETIGFNMKMTEISAAFGREQLKKLNHFMLKRIRNYLYLKTIFDKSGLFIHVEIPKYSLPCFFGFTLTFKETGKRDSLVQHFEKNGIRTRPFFAGNITRHKPFLHLKQDFTVADKLMKDSFFIGVHQGLDSTHFDYIEEKFKEWVSQSAS